MKLNSKQLRSLQTADVRLPRLRKSAVGRRNAIYIILDNVLDTYNIGSIFRLADAVAAKKIYLCKGSETPPNHRIKKASVNTAEIVAWEYFESTIDAINDLRSTIPDIQIVSVELTKNSVPYDKYNYKFPVAFVVGHETDGVSEDILKISDAVIELPMHGINISLNVMVSLSIVLYKALEKVYDEKR